jgi:hypothetical protein
LSFISHTHDSSLLTDKTIVCTSKRSVTPVLLKQTLVAHKKIPQILFGKAGCLIYDSNGLFHVRYTYNLPLHSIAKVKVKKEVKVCVQSFHISFVIGFTIVHNLREFIAPTFSLSDAKLQLIFEMQ